MEDLIVRLINLPETIKGLTAEDEDSNYNIYINSKLAYVDQKNTYIHEVNHIYNNHFLREDSALYELELNASVGKNPQPQN